MYIYLFYLWHHREVWDKTERLWDDNPPTAPWRSIEIALRSSHHGWRISVILLDWTETNPGKLITRAQLPALNTTTASSFLILTGEYGIAVVYRLIIWIQMATESNVMPTRAAELWISEAKRWNSQGNLRTDHPAVSNSCRWLQTPVLMLTRG